MEKMSLIQQSILYTFVNTSFCNSMGIWFVESEQYMQKIYNTVFQKKLVQWGKVFSLFPQIVQTSFMSLLVQKRQA